jgi:hypothetical protein
MKISKEDFHACVSEGLLTSEQAEELWQALQNRVQNRPKYDLAGIAYAIGIGIVIASMSWLMRTVWYAFGGAGIFTTGIFYTIGFLVAGSWLWHKQNRRILGGLLVMLAVCLTPITLYGLQMWAGVWPHNQAGNYQEYYLWVKNSWLVIELTTILIAFCSLKITPLPLLTVPIILCLWIMAIDLTPLLLGQIDLTWEQQLLVCLWFGLTCLVVAYGIDLREKKNEPDYAFWFYFFGLLSFWVGISLMGGEDQLQRFLYCLINLGLIALAALLKRRVFLLFGGVGVLAYFYQLAYSFFKNTIFFPLALSILGFIILGLGIFINQNRHPKRQNNILRWLPQRLREIRQKDIG